MEGVEEGEAAGSESPGVDSESLAAHTPQRAAVSRAVDTHEPRVAERMRVERRVAARKAGVDTLEPDDKSPPPALVGAVCIRHQAASKSCRC